RARPVQGSRGPPDRPRQTAADVDPEDEGPLARGSSSRFASPLAKSLPKLVTERTHIRHVAGLTKTGVLHRFESQHRFESSRGQIPGPSSFDDEVVDRVREEPARAVDRVLGQPVRVAFGTSGDDDL